MMTQSTPVEPCPSRFTLERWHQGELAGEPERSTAEHARRCQVCTRRLEELAAGPPPLDLERAWREARPASRRPWQPETQVKGPPWTLSLIARHGDGSVSRVAPGGALRPGERLRFEVSTTWRSGHVAIVSLDARGTVSPLVPVRGNATAVKGGVKTLLDGAVELDDSIGGERVLLVGCPYAASVDMVVGAASAALTRAGGDPRGVTALALGCHEESFWFEKVAK